MKDLIPWGRDRKTPTRLQSGHHSPVLALQRDIGRIFDDFWHRIDHPDSGNGLLGTNWPTADVSETDKTIEVSVELPGMDEKDIEVSMSDDVLTIRGEKKTEIEKKEKGYYLSERSFGSFYRTIPLPAGVDTGKAEAQFKKGVLTITLPKAPEAEEKIKKIQVKGA
jgi:HSP20 family protein